MSADRAAVSHRDRHARACVRARGETVVVNVIRCVQTLKHPSVSYHFIILLSFHL